MAEADDVFKGVLDELSDVEGDEDVQLIEAIWLVAGSECTLPVGAEAKGLSNVSEARPTVGLGPWTRCEEPLRRRLPAAELLSTALLRGVPRVG